MIEYASREITQLEKQYSMFLYSLKLIDDPVKRNDICFQMDKLEINKIEVTNQIYEEKYQLLANYSGYLIEEEKNRLIKLVSLIEERKDYIHSEVRKHRENTGNSLGVFEILGEKELDEYESRINIIDKYRKNVERITKLNAEVNSINSTLSDAIKKIKYNNNLNREMESKLISLLEKSFKELQLLDLISRRNEIMGMYEQFSFAYDVAKENLKLAKEKGLERYIIECDDILSKVALEYNNYNEQRLILELLDMYDDTPSDYNELRTKREKINKILEGIENTDLYSRIIDEVKKQYNTILIEEQDVNTFNSLAKEKEIKNKELFELEEETNSERFKEILVPLLENERKHKEEQLMEQRRKEYEERQQKLIEEKKVYDERIKRQQLINQQRKKEQEARARELIERQQNSALNKAKVEEETKSLFKPFSFEVKVDDSEDAEISKPELKFSDTTFTTPINLNKSVVSDNDKAEKIPVIKSNNLIPEKIDEAIVPLNAEIKKEDVLFPEIKNTENAKKDYLSGDVNDFKFKGWDV